MTFSETYSDPRELSSDLILGQKALLQYQAMRNLPPIRLPARPDDASLLEACKAFRCGKNAGIAGWEIGSGPTVGLIHGWGGQGVQFVKLAHLLAANGFRAIIMDARNHGSSEPARLGFDRFMTDIAELQEYLGEPPSGWVGHSAGALALMSGRRTHGIRASTVVCLAAPFFPYVPLNRMRAAGVAENVIDHIKHLIAAEFSTDWTSLENGEAWLGDPQLKLMAIYDRADQMIDAQDAERLIRVRPDARVEMTSGLGHNRIISSQVSADHIISFLSACG